MILLEYIIWSPDPVIFKIPLSFLGLPDRPIVWYGLLFAMGFIIGQQISYRIFKAEGHSEKDVDTLTTFMLLPLYWVLDWDIAYFIIPVIICQILLKF